MGLKFYEFGGVSVLLYICSKVLLLLPIELAENIVSQATAEECICWNIAVR